MKQDHTGLTMTTTTIPVSNEAPKKPLLNWEKEVAPVINSVIEKLNSGELKDSDVEKMAMVYFVTTLIVNSHAPKHGLEKVREMLKQFYIVSRKEPHVQLFILESFYRLYATTNHRRTIPEFTAANYESILLGEKPIKDKEVKKYEKRATLLNGQIQTILQDKSQQYLMVEPAEHRLIQDAWFQWYQNDRVLFLIHQRLSDILAKHPINDLEKSQYQAQLIMLRKQFDKPLIGLGLNDRAWTSDWGRGCYNKIEHVFSTLHISSAATTGQAQPVLRHSTWKIYGEFIHGDHIERIGVRMKKEIFMEIFTTEEIRRKAMADMVTAAFEKDLNTKGASTTEAEKKEFTEILAKYVDLEVGKDGRVILGNKHLGVGLDLLCSELERSSGKPMQSATPFWLPPLPTVQFSDDSKEILKELKETCQLEVDLVVDHGKPMVRITISPEQPIARATKSLIKELKGNLLKDLADVKGLMDEKERPDGLILELSGEPSALKVVHIWLCQVAAIQPELKENDNPKYRCNVM